MRISLGGLVSSTMHHGNHEQLSRSQETDSLRLQNLRSYTQQIASHLSDPDYDLYMEYNDDSHYLCALQGGDTEDHQIFQTSYIFLTRQLLPLWQTVIKLKCMVQGK